MANIIFKNLEDSAVNIAASKRPLLLGFDSTNKRLKYFDAGTVEYEALTLDGSGTPTRSIGALTTGALTAVGDVSIGTDVNNKLVINDTLASYLLANSVKVLEYLYASGRITINANIDDVDTAIWGTSSVAPNVFIDAGDNRVGVGTLEPTEKLHIVGNIKSTGALLDGAVTINDSGASVDFRVEGDTDANLLTAVGSLDKVGIGTASPTDKFHVAGGSIRISSGDLIIGGTTGYKLWFQDYTTSGNEMRITAAAGIQLALGANANSGAIIIDGNNVGIGTALPTEKLEVAGAAAFGELTPDSGGYGVSLRPVFGKKIGTATAVTTSYVLLCKAEESVSRSGTVGRISIYGDYDSFASVDIDIQNSPTMLEAKEFFVHKDRCEVSLVTLTYSAVSYFALKIVPASTSTFDIFFSGRAWVSYPTVIASGSVSSVVLYREANIIEDQLGNVGLGEAPTQKLTVAGAVSAGDLTVSALGQSLRPIYGKKLGTTDDNRHYILLCRTTDESIKCGTEGRFDIHSSNETTTVDVSVIDNVQYNAQVSKFIVSGDIEVYLRTLTYTVPSVSAHTYYALFIPTGTVDVIFTGRAWHENPILAVDEWVSSASGSIPAKLLMESDKTTTNKDIWLAQDKVIKDYSGNTLLPIPYKKLVKVLTDNVATSLFEIALPNNGQTCSGVLSYEIHVHDGSGNYQTISGLASYTAGVKDTVVDSDILSGLEVERKITGTLTGLFSTVDGTSKVTIQVTADTSLTPSGGGFYITYTLETNSSAVITIL